jgi:hypothetical protein
LKVTGYIEDGEYRIQKPIPREDNKTVIAVRQFTKKHCRLCVVLRRLMQEKKAAKKSEAGIPIWWHVYMPPSDSAWIEAWKITEHYLLELNREVEFHGGKLVIFSIPEFIVICDGWEGEVWKYSGSALPAGFDPFYPIMRLRELSDEHGLMFYSLEQHFLRYKQENDLTYPYFYYDCDGHLNELGHSVLTERVFEILDRGGHLVCY